MSRDSESAKPARAAVQRSTSNDGFIDRLQLVLRHWPSADRLARATGVSPSAFRKWLRGEAEPSRERLVGLAHAAGVNVGWLASGDGPSPQFRVPAEGAGRTSPDEGIERDYVLLPKRPASAAAGAPSALPPPPLEFMALRHDWVRATFGIAPDQVLLEAAVGDSMLPGIQSGDLLLIDASERRFGAFGVYVLEVAGERLVKRVQPKLDGSVTLISDNPAYESEHLSAERAAGISVIGRVIWTCGPPRATR